VDINLPILSGIAKFARKAPGELLYIYIHSSNQTSLSGEGNGEQEVTDGLLVVMRRVGFKTDEEMG
jgi:hypothetical protein